MKILYIFLLSWLPISAHTQAIYFPPTTGNVWDTMSPARLGWCQPAIDSLYGYLQQTNTSAFIVLKDGKIVLEKYFGTFTADSAHYWASAGKSFMSMLTGIAQEKGLLGINTTVSTYLGNGWTSAPVAKESVITVRQLLNMTSGLDDKPTNPCENTSSTADCLQYLADTGMRWAYHTGAYQQLSNVISNVSGSSINAFTNVSISNKIGMSGVWFNGVYYSKARSMARFGLLALNKGIWANNDSILKDRTYWNAMVNTSQPYNQAYGYLWWLNGKSTFIAPGSQLVFSGNLIPKAPADMFAALGKNDQKIYIIPSKNMVVIRTGESAYGVALAFSPFDNLLWGKIDSLDYKCNYTFIGNGNWNISSNWAGGKIPPSVLDKEGMITISPIAGGECILNVPQTITSNANLVLPLGSRLRILGNLTILSP
jgi:CubicO group peptidase (beta-lactamase class C family)